MKILNCKSKEQKTSAYDINSYINRGDSMCYFEEPHSDSISESLSKDQYNSKLVKEPLENPEFLIKNKWEGIIEEKDDQKVYVRLYDYKTDSEDTAEFELEKFNGAFRSESIEEGQLFYMYLGYEHVPFRKTMAMIKFRPKPNIKSYQEDLKVIIRNINALKKDLSSTSMNNDKESIQCELA